MEVPSVAEITVKTLEVLGRRPCLWQCRVAQAQLRGDKDIVCILGTGSGKTLTFWIPLLFRPEGIQVVIMPLNLLGSQNTTDLEKVGIRGIALSGKTATRQNFEAIELLCYRVIVVNPEVAFQVGGGFQRLWKKAAFTSRLISVIWDEAHCVKAWADFRPEYAQALSAVLRTLQVPREKTLVFHRSNDQPNVYFAIHKMQYTVSSFKDLDFLIPADWKPGTHIPNFVVFFDSIEDSMKAAGHVQKCLPPEYRHKIMWINSDVTTNLRELATQEFARGELIGLFCTDSFGMGVDVPNIELVIQWRTTCDMDTLWQRFGRAARGPGTHALAILIVEGKYFDAERAKAVEQAKKKEEKQLKKAKKMEQGKRKRVKSTSTSTVPTRRRLDSQPTSLPADLPEPLGASGEASAEVELSQFEQLRVEFKVASSSPGAARCKKKGKQAEKSEGMCVEMDNMVNAGTRPFNCHRAPITALYANDRFVPDNLQCRSQDEGCAQCCIPPSSVCCALCSPDHPVFTLLPAVPTPQPSRPRASKLPTKYTMSDKDRDFQIALNNLRRDTTQVQFGLAILNNLGPDLIMGDSILERITQCARAHKLGSLEDLYRETKWDQTWELGEEVLQLVRQHYPRPSGGAPGVALAEGSDNIPTASGNVRLVCTKTCGACGQVGHTRRSRTCPQFNNTLVNNGKENHAPSGSCPSIQAATSDVAAASASGTTTHSHSQHVSTAVTPARASGDSLLSSFIESPSYWQTRTVLSPAEIEARLWQAHHQPPPPAPLE